MVPAAICAIEHRYDATLLFDVVDGNPNGDPDTGNLPRVDPDTLQGLVSDVALKRRIRDYIDRRYGTQPGMAIYMRNGASLPQQHARAYHELGFALRGNRQPAEQVEAARNWMAQQFYDVRMFGAVMTTGANCGQLRGPLQISFARSIDPVTTMDMAITRLATVQPGQRGDSSRRYQVDLGRKPMIPYGLYRTQISFFPAFAARNHISSNDLKLLWESLLYHWDDDPSASRGRQACRGLYVYRHTSPLGDAPSHRLNERIRIVRRPPQTVARQFGDYEVSVDQDDLPARVELYRLTA